jgi:vacuolar-type H+-ATPase subunit I/STV1
MAWAYLRIESYEEWQELLGALRHRRAIVLEDASGQRRMPAKLSSMLTERVGERLKSAKEIAAELNAPEERLERVRESNRKARERRREA